MLQSIRVGDAAYNSEWYTSPLIASYIKMIMIRATKPVILTAGGIVNVNKQTMTSVSNVMKKSCTQLVNHYL